MARNREAELERLQIVDRPAKPGLSPEEQAHVRQFAGESAENLRRDFPEDWAAFQHYDAKVNAASEDAYNMLRADWRKANPELLGDHERTIEALVTEAANRHPHLHYAPDGTPTGKVGSTDRLEFWRATAAAVTVDYRKRFGLGLSPNDMVDENIAMRERRLTAQRGYGFSKDSMFTSMNER